MPKSRGNNKPRPNHAKRVEKKLRMAESLNPFLKKYLANLEAENEQMKTDPNTTVGKLIPQMREAISQNKRLSVLAAALIEAQGGAVTITKTSLEAFESKVLNIKWTLPEGEDKVDEASEFVFTYEAQEQSVPPQQEAPEEPVVTLTPLGEDVLDAIDELELKGGDNEELTPELIADHQAAVDAFEYVPLAE